MILRYSVILTFFFFIVFSGCNQKSQTKKNTIHLSIISQVRSLDPRVSNEYPSVHMINMLYDGLTRLDSKGDIVPGVAKAWDISSDQKTYTFYLRDSHWTNGELVTAYDFEYAWKKSVTPEYAKNGAFTFYSIKNVEACLSGNVPIEQVGIRALDKDTLEVELEHPAPYFLSLCACSTYSPINKNVDINHPEWPNSINQHFVCNGPFILKEWKKNSELCFEKNPLYWDEKTISIAGINIQILPDTHTQFLLFEQNELDWVGYPFNPMPVDIIASTKINGMLKVIDAYGLYWFFVNTEKPPFNNKNFRRAIALAINRDLIAKHIFQLGEKPALGILNSKLAVTDKPYFQDGDILRAKQHLKEALSEMGTTIEEICPIVLSQRSCLFTKRINQAIQQQLAQNLGLIVEIDQVDWPVHFNRMSRGDYAMGEMGWNSWLNDPIYMLDTFRCKSFLTNMSQWEHEEYKRLLNLSDHETIPQKRREILRQAEAFLMEEMPVIPVCFNKLHYLSNPKLKNVYISPLKEIDFRYAYFD